MKYTKGFTNIGSILTSKGLEVFLNRIVRDFEEFEKKERDPKRRKGFWLEQICKHLFTEEWENPRTKNLAYKKVMGQMSQMTLPEIRHIFEASVRWRKNPTALFWKLVKEKRAKIKAQVSHSQELSPHKV